MGPRVARWQERFLVHGEGDALGDPVRLILAERYILNRIYEYDPATGQLAHDRVLIGMGKGNSKTEQVARLGHSELMGPMAPIRSPRVVMSASSYDQTRELFTAARLAIEGDADHGRPGPLYQFFRDGDHLLEDRILLPDGHGYIERIAAVGSTSDGGKPTAHLGDELHEWNNERQERVYTVQGKSTRKRRVLRPHGIWGALQVGITTAGADKDSLLGRLYDHGVRVALGEIEDPGFLFLWWESDPDLDIEDAGERTQAILQANPAAVTRVTPSGGYLPLASIHSSYLDPTVPKHEFIRYNLNRFPTNELQWMQLDVWEACESDLGLVASEPVYACIRVAYDHRSAALAWAQRRDDRVVVRTRTFGDDELYESDAMDVQPIEKALVDLHREYRARVLMPKRYSPKGRERMVPAPGPEIAYHGSFFERSAQELQKRGMVLVDIPNSQERIAPAAETLLELALSGKLAHDGDASLAAQVYAVDAKPAVKGWTLAPHSDRVRIEAAVAAMHAVHRAMTAPRPQSRRVRGL